MSFKKKEKKSSGLGNFFSGIKNVFSKDESKGSPKELVKESPKELVKESAVPILQVTEAAPSAIEKPSNIF